MTPEQLALAQRPAMPMTPNQGVQASPAMMSMVRQPAMVQQPPVVGGQGMVANQRVGLQSIDSSVCLVSKSRGIVIALR